MENLISLFKSLSDETRVRILHLLYQQDLCVCEMVEILDLDQPKISKHMAKIKLTDLVIPTKNQQFIYYSINKNSELYPLIETVFSTYKSQQTLQDDYNKLQTIETFVCER